MPVTGEHVKSTEVKMTAKKVENEAIKRDD
jgi:hypothetical protein